MKRASATIAAALLFMIAAGFASSLDAETIGAGLTGGIPHGLALTLELPRGYPLIVQGHAGSAIIFSSLGAKVMLYPHRWRIQPFVFIGRVLAHSYGVDSGYPAGTGSYLWRGVGVRYSASRFLVFAEISYLSGGDAERAFGETQQGYSGGVLMDF